VGTTIICAAEALFRLPFPALSHPVEGFDLCRKHRKLLAQLVASAMGALSLPFVAAAFKQFSYLAAIVAFILVNRHLCRFQTLISLLKGLML
jgi:hypothetical protein